MEMTLTVLVRESYLKVSRWRTETELFADGFADDPAYLALITAYTMRIDKALKQIHVLQTWQCTHSDSLTEYVVLSLSDTISLL